MRIERIEPGPISCEDCLRDYPDNPLPATTRIDMRYLCDVCADEIINKDLYDEIDDEYYDQYEDD